MLRWFLNTVYLALVAGLFPYFAWSALTQGKYRAGAAEKFWGRVPHRPPNSPQHIWLHAVSVGEVNLLAPLIAQLQTRHPGTTFHITTTTKAGHDLAISKYSQHTVSYAPLDFSWAVHEAYRRIHPDLVLLVELELWPNWVRAARAHGAKIAVVNGRLSEKSHRGYRRLAWLIRPLLQRLDQIAVQDATYAARFIDLGAQPHQVVVTGSVKFDGISADRNNPQTAAFRQLAALSEEDIVWLAGSTQAGEEEIVLDAFTQARQHCPSLRLILVPRHPHRFDEVARLLEARGETFVRRSRLAAPLARPADILLVDSVGELSAWWGMADIAFVGGSLGNRGGQNMIEPAAYGAAVSFGPNTWNFKDVVERLVQAEAATVVRDADSLAQFVHRAATDAPWRIAMGERGRAVVLAQQGATIRTTPALAPLLLSPLPTQRAA